MAKSYPPEKKLEALGRIATGESLKEIASDLQINYGTLAVWKKELKEAETNKDLSIVKDAAELVVKETAKKVEEELSEVVPEPDKIEQEIEVISKGVIGYQVLSEKFQTVAHELAIKIESFTRNAQTAGEIESLVLSLAKLQEAFFNKNITNINVLQNNQVSSTSVSQFKDLLKP